MKTIDIEIKHFNNAGQKQKAAEYAKEVGLKDFNRMAFQHSMIPEGKYKIDLKNIFSNQYNTIDTEGKKGYRVFEYSECLTTPTGYSSTEPLGYGYYISKGIEEIRAYQKDLNVCGYCGKQYYKSKKVWCNACLGSEHLTEDNYLLLKLKNINDDSYYKGKIPKSIINKIKANQKQARLLMLEKEKIEHMESILRDIKNKKIELKAFTWLVEKDIDFNNVIFYTHTNTFCFGWRDLLNDKQKEVLNKKLKNFPYNWEFKK